MSEHEGKEERARRRRPLGVRKRAAFGLATVAVLLGVTEVFFRIREVVRENRRPHLPTEYDDYRQVALIPGATYHRPEIDRRITVNAHGLRGPEVAAEKPAGAFRIACVGGSTTFGLYASDDDTTWPARLEQRLREAGHEQVEALNCGAPGWTSRSSMTNLEMVVFDLEPDLVVVDHAYNDLMSNGDPALDRYVRESKLDDWEDLYHPQDTALFERSALFRFIKSRLRDPYDAFLEKQDRVAEEGVEAFARNLRRIVRRSREEGADVALCTYPTAYRPTYEESQADAVPEVKEWYEALCPLTYPKLIEGLERYNATIRRVAEEEGVPLIELAETFPKDVDLYASPLHHSDAGERLMAEEIHAGLEAAGLLDALEE